MVLSGRFSALKIYSFEDYPVYVSENFTSCNSVGSINLLFGVMG